MSRKVKSKLLFALTDLICKTVKWTENMHQSKAVFQTALQPHLPVLVPVLGNMGEVTLFLDLLFLLGTLLTFEESVELQNLRFDLVSFWENAGGLQYFAPILATSKHILGISWTRC